MCYTANNSMTYILTFHSGNKISDYILNDQYLPDNARLIWLKMNKLPRWSIYTLMTLRSLVLRWFGYCAFSGRFFSDESLREMRSIKPTDTVILFDVFNARYQRLIAQEVKNKKVRVFLWDCLSEYFFDEKKARRKAERMLKYGLSLYTYSPIDAMQFGFKLIPQIYTSIDASNGNNIEHTDILFVGKDRRRYKTIISIIEQIKFEGIAHRICLMQGKRDKVIDYLKPYYISERISYTDMLDMVKASSCILEVIRGDNSGWTLRTMEALMYDKKLITTNRHIVDAPFYNPSNIYIWGEESRNITSFLSEPHQYVPEEIKRQYYFENWIRFFDEDAF